MKKTFLLLSLIATFPVLADTLHLSHFSSSTPEENGSSITLLKVEAEVIMSSNVNTLALKGCHTFDVNDEYARFVPFAVQKEIPVTTYRNDINLELVKSTLKAARRELKKKSAVYCKHSEVVNVNIDFKINSTGRMGKAELSLITDKYGLMIKTSAGTEYIDNTVLDLVEKR